MPEDKNERVQLNAQVLPETRRLIDDYKEKHGSSISWIVDNAIQSSPIFNGNGKKLKCLIH